MHRHIGRTLVLLTLGATLVTACGGSPRAGSATGRAASAPVAPVARTPDPREVHLANLRQVTFGGENAEAYWAFSGKELIFQSTRPPYACDQIFRMAVDRPAPELVSTGKGRTTCAYFYPGDRRVIYSSTHLGDDACPAAPDHSQGYVWGIDESYDIFSARPDGSELVRLTETPGYDAEATVCPRDGSIIFTSVRDGDLELYRMDADGENVKRLTETPGYDGGAFFNADCSRIVWRASRPQGEALEEYRALQARHLVRPGKMELWVANADGSDARQVTYLGAASFAPFFFPSGERIIFSSNHGGSAREFDLWAVNVDGTGLERITWTGGFDGFPMFSPDGRQLAFASNRDQAKPGETNVYLADWADAPPRVEEAAADRYAADVRWLADDAREGRGVDTAGIEAAAAWLEGRFQALGLEPAYGGSYRQPVEVTVAVKPGAGTAVVLDGKPLPVADYVPLGLSAEGDADGAVVFAGYGVTARDLGVDDYARVKAKGKIVVVRRFVPAGARFESSDAQRRYGDPHYKAWNAREHGARALVIVDLPEPEKGQPLPDEAPLPPMQVEQFGDATLPVVAVKRAVGERLLAGRHRMQVSVRIAREKRAVHNVVGRLRAGARDAVPEAVVIGAHYDHLGHGGTRSMAPGVKAVHNGADDNASGVAALLEAALLLGERRAELRRDVLVAAFVAEELGLVGSTQLTRQPPPGVAMKDLVAMVNADMVGRLRGNRLSVIGAGSAEQWAALLGPVCEAARIECVLDASDGYGPSDQTPFYAAGVPVLHLFTGAHQEYHTPSDDPAYLNMAGGAQVGRLFAEIAVAAANRAERLTLKAAPAPLPTGDFRSYGASLGTVPDYTGNPGGKPGVLLAGVRPGGAADQAGLQRGDLLVRIGKQDIGSVHDLMYVLRNARPGEKTKLVYERDGRRHEVEATFGQSTRRH